MAKPEISIVIPAYNEEQNVILIYKELRDILEMIGKRWEIIYIDDGSADRTFENLNALHSKDNRVKIVKFRTNFGQTAALDAGFKAAQGKIVISLDADLQDNPTEIPNFLEKLKQGYDVVCAWRIKRKDSLSKHLFSRFANILRRFVLGAGVHDSGCTFRAYRKEAIKDLNLFGEMHRYLPYLLMWKGFKVGELKVVHRQRKFGKTKYGVGRLFKGFIDMLVMKFWMQYSTRPAHLFGGFGALLGVLGFLTGIWLVIEKFVFGTALANRPLLLLAVLLIVLGMQFLLFGILADIMIKTYYRTTTHYTIERKLE